MTALSLSLSLADSLSSPKKTVIQNEGEKISCKIGGKEFVNFSARVISLLSFSRFIYFDNGILIMYFYYYCTLEIIAISATPPFFFSNYICMYYIYIFRYFAYIKHYIERYNLCIIHMYIYRTKKD